MNKLLGAKLSSHALVLTVTIATVIFIFVSGFFLITIYDKKFSQAFLNYDQALHDLNSGQVILLSNPKKYEQSSTVEIEENKSVELSVVPWGIFQVATIKSTSQKSLSRSFFIGYTMKDSSILELQNSKSILKIAGNTVLNGKVICPNKYIEQAYINSKPFIGKLTTNKGIIESKNTQNIPFHTININLINSKNGQKSDLDTIVNSFLDSTLVLDDFTVQDIRGKVLLVFNHPVNISSNLHLENVIIKAPSITIAPFYKGTAQFIAKDSIIVGSNVVLNFPSALLIENTETEGRSTIKIGTNCKINGVIQLRSPNLPFEKSFVEISSGTTINGEILCSGSLKMNGTELNGRICTNRFIDNYGSSLYYNTLIDVKINGEILEKNAVFCSGTKAKVLLYVP